MVERFEDFEMPQCCVIQREIVVPTIKRQPREMLHVAAQVLREIMQRRAGRADGGGAVLQPEPVERRDLEMVAHRIKRGFRRERPVVVAIENPALPRSRACESALTIAWRNLRRLKSAATKQFPHS